MVWKFGSMRFIIQINYILIINTYYNPIIINYNIMNYDVQRSWYVWHCMYQLE